MPTIPGVPSHFNPANVPPSVALMRSDGVGVRQLTAAKPVWGIFLRANPAVPVLKADTVLTFEFHNSWRLSTFPQEQGAFQSYNKVSSPYQARATFSRSGTETERAQFLQTIEDISNSLTLYDIVTPERIYHDANIYDYNLVRRTESGVGLISVEILFEEVRVTATTMFSMAESVPSVLLVGDTKPGIVNIPSAPSGYGPISLGNVQAVTPSPLQTTNFNLGQVLVP